jgi:type II secretory pathway pseudopilin PulG
MIVITLIAIISAIAIPNLLESKKTANESAVISTLRTVSASQEIYCSRFGAYGSLSSLSAEGFIDEVLGTGAKHGYTFSVPTADKIQWICTAIPNEPGQTGHRGFRVDSSGVIRFTSDGTAPTSTSPALDE